MAPRSLKRLLKAHPDSLGLIRIVVCGVFLVSILLTSFENLGQLPVTVMRPTGVMQYVPWSFFDALLTPTGTAAFKAMLVLALAAATIGFFTRTSTVISLFLVAFYQGLVRSLGHFNHDEMIAVYSLAVLAVSPCGHGLSIDAWLGRNRPFAGRSFIYGYPIVLMQLLLAWSYFGSALLKLRINGLAYFDPNTLPALAIWHSLDNLHDTHFRVAFYLPNFGAYLVPFVVLTVLWELVFPVAILSRRSRPFILGYGLLFHAATLLVMNITFPFHVLMYSVFVNWRYLLWRSKKLLRRAEGARPRVSDGSI